MGSLDRSIFLWVVGHRVGWLNPVFEIVTYAATGGWIWLLVAVGLALRTHRPVLPTLGLVAACVWGADALSYAIKALTGRPRPFVAIQHVHLLVSRPSSTSLSSAHATTAWAGAVALGYLFPAYRVPLGVLALAVSFSRIYVGVHYPGDVLASAVIGSVFAAGTIIALRAWQRSRTPIASR